MYPAPRDVPAGGYRYIPFAFQYSAGVAALPGFEITRLRLSAPVPLRDGFALIEETLARAERPRLALAAIELRSPAPFTPQGFFEFNKLYVETLKAWGIYGGGADDNPVARTNVCPELDPPREPSLYAFSYTIPITDAEPRPLSRRSAQREGGTFVIAGSGEATAENIPYEQKTVRYGETSSDAMREKVRFVVNEITRRMAALGVDWRHVTASQVYTVYDFSMAWLDPLIHRHGPNWHYARPPVNALAFELDCRAVHQEVFGAP